MNIQQLFDLVKQIADDFALDPRFTFKGPNFEPRDPPRVVYLHLDTKKPIASGQHATNAAHFHALEIPERDRVRWIIRKIEQAQADLRQFVAPNRHPDEETWLKQIRQICKDAGLTEKNPGTTCGFLFYRASDTTTVRWNDHSLTMRPEVTVDGYPYHPRTTEELEGLLK